MVTQHKETGSREVRVEFDEDDVGGRVDRLQSCVPTKLPNLGRGLVRAIPAEKQRETQTCRKLMLQIPRLETPEAMD